MGDIVITMSGCATVFRFQISQKPLAGAGLSCTIISFCLSRSRTRHILLSIDMPIKVVVTKSKVAQPSDQASDCFT